MHHRTGMSPSASPSSATATGSLLGVKKKKSKKRTGRRDADSPPLRTLREKLEIIEFAKSSGNRAAGREFNVAESSIREWRKNESRLRMMLENEPEGSHGISRRSRDDHHRQNGHSESKEEELLIKVPVSLLHLPDLNGLTDEVKEEKDEEGQSSTASSTPTVSPGSSLLVPPTSSSRRRKPAMPRKLVIVT